MRTDEIICTCIANYAETLRQIPIGKARTYELTGRAYTAFMTARSRIHAKKEGSYVFEINADSNTIKITRTA